MRKTATSRRSATESSFWFAATVFLVLSLCMGPGALAAPGEVGHRSFASSGEAQPTRKAIAPPGVLEEGMPGVMLWQDYGSFALYRVSEAAWSELPAEVRGQLRLVDDLDHLLFDRGPVGTEGQGALQYDAAGMIEGSEAALHLVQFVGPIKDAWLAAISAAGATPIHYIATHGYLVWADGPGRAQLAVLAERGEFVQFSAPYPPSFKVGPALAARENPDDVVPVVIQMYRHDGRANTEATIRSLAIDVLSDWTPILEFQNAIVTLRVRDVDEIASLPDVFWIEERLERQLTDEVQGQIVAGNLNPAQSGPSGPGYLSWLDSYGFSTDPADYPIVDVTDDGIGNGTVNSGDPTLHQFGVIANPTRLAYVANCTNSASGEGVDGHGHINASIAGGYDARSGFPFQDPLGYRRGLGISPYGRLAGTRVFDPGYDASGCGGTDTGVIKSIQDNGALINTNSWGCAGCAGSYDDSSQAYDVGVRDADLTEPGNQEMIIVFSAGNSGPSSGTVGTPGNGKNMITVGASENQRPSDEDGAWTDGCGVGPSGADNAMDVIGFSSRGPSPGSRVKPEVIAPGTHIQGTASTNAGYTGSGVCDQYRPSGQNVFAASSGTSHSTPSVAGVASLAYWWVENTYGVATPSPALMKAYLIGHPTYLTGTGANDTLPSNSQGYGMPNMGAMFDDASKFLLDQSVTFDNSGEAWTWEGAVVDPTRPVRIVLAYTDAPGAIGTSPQVNDLNLVAQVDGSAYKGNVFSGQWSVTGGSADPYNNYEAVFLPSGTSGSIGISVTGFNIAGDGVPNTGDSTDQDFALVCYNCAQTSTFSLNVTPASLDVCAPSDAVYNVEVGSILGFKDPVALSASGNPAGTTVGFSVNPVMPPGSSTLTVGKTGSAAAGSYAIQVEGTSTPGTEIQPVELNLFDAAPATPGLLTPADGAVNVLFQPTFSWTAVAQAASYLLEVATSASFTNIVYSAGETGTSHTAAAPLSAGTTYYWRVTAQNVCGAGTSANFRFTTQAATMVCNGPAVDFEGGIPSDWTVVSNSPGGIVWTTTADPACEIGNRTNGSGEAACADSDAAGSGAPPYDTELVSNPFDLSSVGAAVLDVKAYYNDISTGYNDRFEVDVWDGVGWTNELTWDEDHMPEDFSLNLSPYAGLPVVQVRFPYSGNGYDWYAQVDDIALTCVPTSPPTIEVDPASLTASQATGVVSTQPMTVTNSGGSPLNWNVIEDDTACDSPTDIPWLTVAPDAGTTAPLDSTVVDVSFDSSGLAPGDYTANLCVESNDPTTPVVQVPAVLTVVSPAGLVCNGAMIQFEDGIPLGWQVVDNTGGAGIVWTTTADPACGQGNLTNGTGEAACADSDAAGSGAPPYDTELRSPPIDLTGQGIVVLDVKAYYRDIGAGNDGFEVDVWDGVGWTNELAWDENHMPEDLSLDLSAYAGQADVRVRFRYYGNGYDWYAQVDDLALTCAPVFALECNGEIAGFEAGIPFGWQVIDNEGSGVVWTDIAGSGESGNYTGGTGDAATASSDMAGETPFDTELRTAGFDLSGWLPGDDVTLQYLANYQNFGGSDFLDLDLSPDGGATWINLLNWNEDHGSFRTTPGAAVSIDLSAFAGMSALQLRWHYYDSTADAWDWYAQIDEVGLACVGNPAIDVDPSSLSSTQVPGQAVTQILTIGNVGNADLTWSIDEDVGLASTGIPAVEAPPAATGAGPRGMADPAKLAADNVTPPRSAPEEVGSGRALYVPRPDVILLAEGFEGGSVPPAGWTHVQTNPDETWKLFSGSPHSGVYAADVEYDPALVRQDEWLLSPQMSLTEGTLSLWSFGSLHYCRDTYDNCDLNVWLVVGGVGGGDDVLIGKADDDWTGSYTWSQSVFDLSPLLPGGPVRVGLQYKGFDGAQIAVDDIVLDGKEGGPCVSPEDVPWLSVTPDAGITPAGGSSSVDVTTDATGLPPGRYEANVCVYSNDPVQSLVVVPLEMKVNNVPPPAVVEPGYQWPQYSDEIAPVTITAVDNIAEVLIALPSWSADGVIFSPGLPDFLTLSAPGCVDSGGGMQTCTWTIDGAIDLPEGAYTVRTTVSDSHGGVTVVDAVIEVVPEHATVAFDPGNPAEVPATGPGGTSGPFSLTVYVTERVPDLPADPAGFGAPGDIARAQVSMVLVPVGPGSEEHPVSCAVSVSPGGYAGEMTVVCDFADVPVGDYKVEVTVDGGYYAGTGEGGLVVSEGLHHIFLPLILRR